MEEQKEKEKSFKKFNNLNFNLKNQIFSFFPLNYLFEILTKINKKFFIAVNNIDYIQKIKCNFKDLISKIDVNEETVNEIASNYFSFLTSEVKLFEICAYLYIKKKLMFKNCLKISKNFNYKVVLKILDYKFLSIIEINKSDFGLDISAIENLCEILKKENNNIKKFSIYTSKIGKIENSLIFFKDLFLVTKNLIFVNLSFNYIGINEKNVIDLSEGLSNNKSIRELNLSYNNIGGNENSLKYFCEILTKNSTIEILDLGSNLIGRYESHSFDLFYSLEKNISLKNLLLYKNKLGNFYNDNIYISNLLQKNLTLKELNLDYNLLGTNDSFRYIIISLNNSSLGHLNIMDNLLENYFPNIHQLKQINPNLEIVYVPFSILD